MLKISNSLQGGQAMGLDRKSAKVERGSIVRYALGGVMIVVGLSVLLRAQPLHIRPFGAFLGTAGALLLPETSRWLGSHWPVMSQRYVSPLMAAGALLIGLGTAIVGELAWGDSHPTLTANIAPKGSHSAEELAKVTEQARAKIVIGADLAALKIIVQGTDEAERQNEPQIVELLATIRSNLTKSFGPKDADTMFRESLLPPTPKNLGRNEMLAEARSAFNDGWPERGLTIIYDNASPDMLQSDPETRALVSQIETRLREAEATTQGDNFADQVRTYWLLQVNGISTNAPTSAADIWNPVAKLEDAVRALEESQVGVISAEAKKAQLDLRKAIVAKQRELFPVLRAAYGKIVGQVMWENDLDIRVGGTANRSITWTGGLFAARSNVARGQEQALPHLLKLRFATSTYEWARGVGERHTYTMDAPADDAVGYWQAKTFKPIR